MKPYYQGRDAVLYLGDCLSILPELAAGSVDAVVTDPPYGIGYKSGPISRSSISSTRKRFSVTIEGDDRPFDPGPWLEFPAVAFTGAQWFYDRLPSGGSLHCWDKRGEYKPLDQADADFVWISRAAGPRVFRLVWRGICRHDEHDQAIEHPTQKPVALMKWMLDLLRVHDGGAVLDPFAGSGTTGVACLRTGRRFIGVELSEAYCEIAAKRLEAVTNEAPLFDALEPQPVALDLFATAADVEPTVPL